jgi:hypothetical protein
MLQFQVGPGLKNPDAGAFSPGLKPSKCQIKCSRGFENTLPRTESPGLAQLGTDSARNKLESAIKYGA